MRSRASCFNKALLCKNLARFWPLMLLGTIGLFLNNFLSNLDGLATPIYDGTYRNVIEVVCNSLENGMPVAVMVYAFLCATCAFEYLHNTRSSHYIHSLPVHRGSLYVTGMLSGVLFALLPLLASSVLGYGLFAVTGAFRDGAGVLLLKIQTMELAQFLFFYALAVLAHILCGRRLHSLIAFAFLLFFLPVLEITFLILLAPTLFGLLQTLELSTMDVCPIVFWTDHNYAEYVHGNTSNTAFRYDADPTYVLNLPWGFTLICLAVGALALVAAYFLYKKRPAETAGQGISFKFVYVPLQTLLALLAAELLAALVLLLLGRDEFGINPYFWLSMILLTSILTFFLSDMLLRRTKKVFHKKGFLRFGLYALGISLLVTVFALDLPHIVRRIPEAENISSVELQGANCKYVMTDMEEVEAFLSIHKEIIDTRKDLMKGHKSSEPHMDLTIDPDLDILMIYTLKNGKTVERSYTIAGDSANLAVRELYNTVRNYYSDPHMNLTVLEYNLQKAHSMELHGGVEVATDDGSSYIEYTTCYLEEEERIHLLDLYRKEIASLNGSLLLDWNYNAPYLTLDQEGYTRYAFSIDTEMTETYAYAYSLLIEALNAEDREYPKEIILPE